MTPALQNRLVGTVILVALVVIFLPDLLDGEKTPNQQNFVSVPQNPISQSIEAPDDFPNEQVIEATRRPVEVISESDITDSGIKSTSNQADSQGNAANGSTEDQATSSQQDKVNEGNTPVPAQSSQNIANQQASNTESAPSTETSADLSLAQQTVINKQLESADDTGWVVQLGSFRYQKNVTELLDKLDAAGYRAFSRRVDTSAGRLNKVFVGPELDKAKLEQALSHLNEVTGLKGKVSSFAEATN